MRHFWLFFVPLCSVLLSFHGFHTCAKPPVAERKLWVADVVGWGGHRLCLQYWPPKLATCVVFFLRVPPNYWSAFQQTIAEIKINVPKETNKHLCLQYWPTPDYTQKNKIPKDTVFAVCLLLNLAQLVKPLKSFCQQFWMFIFHQSIYVWYHISWAKYDFSEKKNPKPSVSAQPGLRRFLARACKISFSN